MMDKEYISSDIENVEQYLAELFEVPVGICIADTEDMVRNVLGYEIAHMRRQPDPNCVTGFQYVARIEWAPSTGENCSWRLMYALYRREGDHRSKPSKRVEEVERRPLLDMPIEAQRHALQYLSQLVAAAGGEWQLLRAMLRTKRRARVEKMPARVPLP